ncbi:MAG: helix-turn-helix domain-containing protein [Phycisphaeraceae bacterium]|nr:helix-turn-helix domain-containing protein [Phycisphaerales bacterium]MCB9859999.1 helix-turn-helix domain-containing protein [Phycisphaeraceae bacterium]
MRNDTQTPEPLAVRPREAAKLLGIGQRTLWALSQPRGDIPTIRVGTAVLYPVEGLKRWLADQQKGGRQ